MDRNAWRFPVGLVASGIFGAVLSFLLATPVLWFVNLNADDGPYFPAAFVAFAFLVLPTAVVLFPMQLGVLVTDLWFGCRSAWVYPLIGLAGGALAGGALVCFLHSSSSTIWGLSLLTLLGVVQGLATFSSYALVCSIGGKTHKVADIG